MESKPLIKIQKSETADTRTCDFANVTKETLLASSKQHIRDVILALGFFIEEIDKAGARHDTDKITDIDGFHRDFVTGFKQTEWWDRHRQLNRHHLNMADGVREDVNLIDVLDFIADCVMAGMARSGSVYPLQLSPDLLEKAFQNTVELLKRNVEVQQAGGVTSGAETRCPVYNVGGQHCQLVKGHDGLHRHVEHLTTAWHTDRHERMRLAELEASGDAGTAPQEPKP